MAHRVGQALAVYFVKVENDMPSIVYIHRVREQSRLAGRIWKTTVHSPLDPAPGVVEITFKLWNALMW